MKKNKNIVKKSLINNSGEVLFFNELNNVYQKFISSTKPYIINGNNIQFVDKSFEAFIDQDDIIFKRKKNTNRFYTGHPEKENVH